MTRVHMPVTALLGTSMFFSGVTYAATMPYASLVGVDTLGLSPGWFATIMAFGSILGTFLSLFLGYISDKLPDRRILVLIAALGGVAGHGMIYLWPSQMGFTVAMALLMPIGFTCFSQCFAYVRVYYSRHKPGQADFMVTALRTVFTIAWVVVPPVAGWIAAEFSIFDVYLASSLSYGMLAGIFALLMSDPATHVHVPPPVRAEGASLLSTFALPLGTLAGLVGLIVMTVAMRILSFTVPLFIVTDLNGNVTNVGFYAGMTALIEVPCMLLWGWLTTKLTKETLLASAGLVIAVFMAIVAVLDSMPVFYATLILNGLGTAALMSINISYIQEAIKGRVGLSSSLMDVVAIAGNLFGATAFGVLTSGGDYRFALAVGAGVAVLGAGIMAGGNLRQLGQLRPQKA